MGRAGCANTVKIRVICDNEVKDAGLQPSCGSAALIESNTGTPIRFDTGAVRPHVCGEPASTELQSFLAVLGGAGVAALR